MHAGNSFFCERLLSLKSSTLLLLYFSALFQLVGAVPRNFTIDDQHGDERTGQVPVYAPSNGGSWQNEGCVGCAVKPDADKLREHTATAATLRVEKGDAPESVAFDFNGTAIYVFFTLFYNEGVNVTVRTECNFTIDNEAAGFFNHTGDPTIPQHSRIDYQVPVFTKEGLENKDHHMQISMAGVPYDTFLSFDYAMYTADDGISSPGSSAVSSTPNPGTSSSVPSSTSSQALSNSASPSPSPQASQPPAGIIVGGVLGGLAVLAAFLCLLWFYCRGTKRFQRPRNPDPAAPRPFVYSNMANSGQNVSSPWGVERTFVPSTSGATGGTSVVPNSLSLATRNLSHARSTDVPRSSPLPLSPLSSGSNSRGPSVEHRLRDANRRIQSLTAEMASTSSRSTKSRTSSRAMRELVEEVKRLRQEIQILKQSQRSPLDPPPQYNE